MDWQILFILYVGMLFFLLAMRLEIAFALGTVGILGLVLLGRFDMLNSLGILVWNTTNSFVLTCIPLFLFMGEMLLQGGISDKLYSGLSKIIGRFPGSLLQTNVLSCAAFAAISGSSVATAAAIGSVAVPQLTKRGYNKGMILGSLGGGGALGMLIPPSIPMIVYGAMVNESVAKLFMAGLIPGIIAVIFFVSYIIIRVVINKDLVPEDVKGYSFIEKIKAFSEIYQFIILIMIVLGGIYLGVMTPTESAAVGSIWVMIMLVFYKKLNLAVIKKSLERAVKTSCMIFFIIIGANVFTFLIAKSGINHSLMDWVISINPSQLELLLIIFVIYLILGCLIDGLSMIFLTLPIIMPVIRQMGINLIWFGVMLNILVEIAQITPPLGLNLFILHGISKSPMEDIIKSCFPYFLMYLIVLILVYLFPILSLWIPLNMMV